MFIKITQCEIKEDITLHVKESIAYMTKGGYRIRQKRKTSKVKVHSDI